eukprot:2407820-Lingulodinium_polyedra.AAC.1
MHTSGDPSEVPAPDLEDRGGAGMEVAGNPPEEDWDGAGQEEQEFPCAFWEPGSQRGCPACEHRH